MPGRVFLTTPPEALGKELGADPAPIAGQAPRWNVAPGQEIVTLGREGFGLMRWGLIPMGRKNARGRPVMETIVNARSETVFDKTAFAGVQRCLVPVDGWYEWTGATRRKTAWRISRRDRGLIVFAGIWDVWQAPGGLALPQVATVTCPPSLDVRDVHHRMGVILDGAAREVWLHGSAEEAAAVCLPYPEGRLTVEAAVGVDWDGP